MSLMSATSRFEVLSTRTVEFRVWQRNVDRGYGPKCI